MNSPAQSLPPIDPAKVRPRLWAYSIGVLILLLGGLGFAWSLWSGIGKSQAAFQRVLIPGSADLDLQKPGGYTISYESTSVLDGKLFRSDSFSELTCNLFSVSESERVPLSSPLATQTYRFGSFEGESIFAFKIDAPGQYRLSCHSNEEGKKAVLSVVSNDDFNIFRTIVTSLGSLFGGIFLGGISLALVAWLRYKSRQALRRAASSGPPNAPSSATLRP